MRPSPARRLRQQCPSLFETVAPLDGAEPLAWLNDVLERMVSGRTNAHELERLLPWTWQAERFAATVQA
jgi:hypothetical protein